MLTFTDRNNSIPAISLDEAARNEPQVPETGGGSASGLHTTEAREAYLRNAKVVSVVPLLNSPRVR